MGGHLSRLAWGGLKPGSPNLSGVPWPPVASRGFCAHRPPPQDPFGDPQALSDAGRALSLRNTSLQPPLLGFAERGGRAQRAGTGRLPTSASNCSQPCARIPCAWLHCWLVPPPRRFWEDAHTAGSPPRSSCNPPCGSCGAGGSHGCPDEPKDAPRHGPVASRVGPPQHLPAPAPERSPGLGRADPISAPPPRALLRSEGDFFWWVPCSREQDGFLISLLAAQPVPVAKGRF